MLRLLLGLWVVSLVPVLAWRFANPPLTLLMAQRWLAAPAGTRLEHQWVDLETVSRWFPLAVVAAEDQKFPRHLGFDLDSIAGALRDARHGKRLRGASTLTQQVAKNVFLWPGRSWLRKGLEAYYTVLIELLWGKRRILEVYVNLAEMGPYVFGVEAASHHWFGHSAQTLSRERAAILAALLPNPLQRSATAPGPRLRQRQAWVLGQMRQLGSDYLNSVVDPR
jgi:monofunctional biosynthetic peptidoglycan transglycosylase